MEEIVFFFSIPWGSPFITCERKQQSECTLRDTEKNRQEGDPSCCLLHVRTRVVKWFKSHLSPSIRTDVLLRFYIL